MQIDIHAVGVELDDQSRAYVEYRMFSAARRFESNGAQVVVLLEEDASRARARYRCVATMGLGSEGRVRVSAGADRLHAAVDRAADRLSDTVERHLASASSGATSRPA